MATATAESEPDSPTSSPVASIVHAIQHAAHFLPSQGPITAFVHHNTLHALEEYDFHSAVLKGSELYGCHPYLPEEKYREKVTRGRIRSEDIEAVLWEELGDEADTLLGFLGTRIRLRQAILQHPLHDGPTTDLRWVIAESNALHRFREEATDRFREQFLANTRQWIMRDFRANRRGNDESLESDVDRRLDSTLRQRIEKLIDRFGREKMESWNDTSWESFCLHLLWQICEHGVGKSEYSFEHDRHQSVRRHRDMLFELTSKDSDELVNEVLIRFCAAFLDQGFSVWELPDRDGGFFGSFIATHACISSVEPWRANLAKTLRKIQADGTTPLESIQNSLELFGVDGECFESFLQGSLLALRGYAGMLWQMESRGDHVYCPAPAGTLLEYVAIRLILERHALMHIARAELGYQSDLAQLSAFLQAKTKRQPRHPERASRDAFRVFELGQLLGWNPKTLSQLSVKEWSMVVKEINDFSGIQRRKMYHLAFERKYRNATLDAVAIHSARLRSLESTADCAPDAQGDIRCSFQIVCCIDEREESYRRHLEEIVPNCETFGVAGFFAVPIYYRGAADAHYTPLCPANMKPRHYLREEVAYSLKQKDNQRQRTRRTIGTVTHRVHLGSRSLTGGWIGTTLLGTLATFPLVASVLFPRATARLADVLGGFVRPPETTNLHLERTGVNPGPQDEQIGFNLVEMADSVERLLRDIGLTRKFARLVVITGHGSASLNNPHEAAHDCGACGGGRGGPNARAFSLMANDPRVRTIVAERGVTIPDDTVFVGCYHNTCDDSVTFYDLDSLPVSHQPDFERTRGSMDTARKASAHERCRRFDSASLQLNQDEALKHAERRANDLSQVRPEYGHATNSVCFVGNRAWSRRLFSDRRAFLQSYDPAQDDASHSILTRTLQAVIPVCAGISLEYYFSYVDPVGYGCGTKLPHNITSLVGVMNGAASDLRPGLPWQMVEIHEPMRLLFVIESTPDAMVQIISENEGIARLCKGGWVQLAVFDPATSEILLYRHGQFTKYTPEIEKLDVAPTSLEWYRGWRDHLSFASIGRSFQRFENGGADVH